MASATSTTTTSTTTSPSTTTTSAPFGHITTLPSGRRAFIYDGNAVYEFEQTLEDMLVYFPAPKGVPASIFDVKITPTHIRLAIKGNPPYIDEDLERKCVASESVWTIEDGSLHITLTKASAAETWPCVFKGHGTLDAASETEVKKTILLERFQKENPGFDFSQAEINGNVPDPRTFMRE